MKPLTSSEDHGVGGPTVLASPLSAAAAAAPTGPNYRLPAYLIYLGLLVALLVIGVLSHTGRGRKALYKEGAAVETVQLVHLTAATALFGAQVLRARHAASPAARWMPVVLALGVGLALLRETDFAWKRAGLDWAYQVMKVVIALSAVVVLTRHRHALVREWLVRPGPSWPPYALLNAAIAGYAVAQVIPKILKPFGVSFVYTGIAEEAVELLASDCFLIAAIELLVHTRTAYPGAGGPWEGSPQTLT